MSPERHFLQVAQSSKGIHVLWNRTTSQSLLLLRVIAGDTR